MADIKSAAGEGSEPQVPDRDQPAQELANLIARSDAKGKGFWRRRRKKSTPEPAAEEKSAQPPVAASEATSEAKADAEQPTDEPSTEGQAPEASAGDASPDVTASMAPAEEAPAGEATVGQSAPEEPAAQDGATVEPAAQDGTTAEPAALDGATEEPAATEQPSADGAAAEIAAAAAERPTVGVVYQPDESPDGFPMEYGDIIVGLPKKTASATSKTPAESSDESAAAESSDAPADAADAHSTPVDDRTSSEQPGASSGSADHQPAEATAEDSGEPSDATERSSAVPPEQPEAADEADAADRPGEQPGDADDSADLADAVEQAEDLASEQSETAEPSDAAEQSESADASGEQSAEASSSDPDGAEQVSAAAGPADSADRANEQAANADAENPPEQPTPTAQPKPAEQADGGDSSDGQAANADGSPEQLEAAEKSGGVDATDEQAAGADAEHSAGQPEPAEQAEDAGSADEPLGDSGAEAPGGQSDAAAEADGAASDDSGAAEQSDDPVEKQAADANAGNSPDQVGATEQVGTSSSEVAGAAAESGGTDPAEESVAGAEARPADGAEAGADPVGEVAGGVDGDTDGSPEELDEAAEELSAEQAAERVAAEQAAMALITALMRLRGALAASQLPMDVVGADEARQQQKAMLDQLDDYILPRLVQLEAPLLTVVGGSTGAGKSTLVNTIIGKVVSEPGVLRPTTRSPVLIHHPADAEWFAGDRVLPGMARSSGDKPGGMEDPGQLRLVAADTVPQGLAILDAPDIDSVVEANRDLATQLLAAADLWLFVTTAARYADAVPWDFLQSASDRSTAVAVVLDRAPEDTMDDITGHLAQMLLERGLGDSPMFSIKETVVDSNGMLPVEIVASIKDWLVDLAADAEARAAVVRRTLHGAVTAMVKKTPPFAAAVKAQAEAVVELRSTAETAYDRAVKDIAKATQDGTLLRGEVLARWQEFVGTGELLKGLQTNVGRLRDKMKATVVGKPPPTRDLNDAVESGLESLLREHAEAAAERAEESWQSTAPGRQLLAAGDRDLGRMSKDFPAAAGRVVREWQGFVLDLVRKEGADKRSTARVLAYGVNGLGLSLMVVIFASTAGITGAEVGVGAGTAVVGQKLLEAVFGDQAVRTLVTKAREDLDGRVHALMDAEFARYLAVLDQHPVDPDAARQLTEAARAVEDCT